MKEIAPSSLGLSLPSERGDVEGLIRPVVIEGDGISLRDYWRVIRKRLWLIAISCFGTVLVTALVISMMTPIYTAETALLIERHPPQVLNIREALSEPIETDERDFYKTQYEILKSRTVAAWSIRALGLETNGLFTGEGREEGFVARLWAEAEGWARRFFPPLPKTDGERPLGVKPELIDSYLAMLEVNPVQRTRLVKIAFNTPDPELSARLADTHAQAYIRQGLGLRTRANEEAQRFLEEKLVELKGRIETSEAALNRYRRDKQLISAGRRKPWELEDKENIVVERLADLNRRLTEAEADKIALEAQVRLIRKRDYDSLPAVINNALIGTLKEQLARLEGEHAYVSTQFKPGYPRLDQLKAQVEESRRRLRQEIQRAVAGIESSYLAAETKERELRAKMKEQKAAALGLKDASVEYAILAREVDTNSQLYESVLQRMKETGVAAELRASNVSIIDQAEPPRAPSKPPKKKSLLLSALVGLMGGVGLALLLEYLDNTLKTPEEVEGYLRLPILGVVPDFLRLDWWRYAPQRLRDTPAQIPSSLALGGELTRVPFQHPLSVVTEAYRMLRASILLSRAGESPKSLLFTSSIPGEGKTVTVVSTAILFSQMGVRVLVIDADLRRPGCHRMLRAEDGPGLTEVLTGQREPMEVIRPTSTDHLFLLSAGSVPPNPTELLGSKKMQEAIAALQEHYDHILIDSPPVMQVSDAVHLSTMVEGVVLVVNGQETPRHVVREARSRLSYARAKILGVVLNRVNVRSRDYAYYYPPDYS